MDTQLNRTNPPSLPARPKRDGKEEESNPQFDTNSSDRDFYTSPTRKFTNTSTRSEPIPYSSEHQAFQKNGTWSEPALEPKEDICKQTEAAFPPEEVKNLVHECLMFPTYAKKSFDEYNEPHWTAKVKGWVFCTNKGSRRKKVMLGFAKRLAGVSNHHEICSTLEARSRLFLVSRAQIPQVNIKVVGFTEASQMELNGELNESDASSIHGGSALETVLEPEAGHFSGCIEAPSQLVDAKIMCDPKDGSRKLLKVRATATEFANPAYGVVNLIEPYGISIISDIDDTIKASNVSLGTREILTNTFLQDLKEVPGMANVYHYWWFKGASIHYVSNSPWELFPTLESFFEKFTFPVGSAHLKMVDKWGKLWQSADIGKKEAILEILKDFPHRKFILVGDSGELDMELYSKIAREFPDQILKIFIRDVSTSRLSNTPPPPTNTTRSFPLNTISFRSRTRDIAESEQEPQLSPLQKFQARIAQTFEGLPPELWPLFDNAEELLHCPVVERAFTSNDFTKDLIDLS